MTVHTLAIHGLTCDNESGPGGVGSTARSLTPVLDSTEGGLAMNATRTCSIDQCEKVALYRGWCSAHYTRWRRNGTVEGPLPKSKGTPREHPANIVAKAIELYEAGWTISQIREAIPGVSIYELLKRNGVPMRSRGGGRREGSVGPASNMWKGDNANYLNMHKRVYRAKGRPQECDWCGKNDPDARYDWANLTGNYGDIEDYARLCHPCHMAYDAARRRETGEPTMGAHLPRRRRS